MKKLLYISTFISFSIILYWNNNLYAIENISNIQQINIEKYPTNTKLNNDSGTKLDYKLIEKQAKSTASVENETILQDSIVRVWFSSETINVDVFHGSEEGPIVITIYNMLAKPVLIVYKGVPIGGTEKSYIYKKNATALPNGHYFCILDRNNKRTTEKFIISR